METAGAYVGEIVRRLSEPGLVAQLAPAVEAVDQPDVRLQPAARRFASVGSPCWPLPQGS